MCVHTGIARERMSGFFLRCLFHRTHILVALSQWGVPKTTQSELEGRKFLHADVVMCETDEACLEQTASVRGKIVLLDISHDSPPHSGRIAMFLTPADI